MDKYLREKCDFGKLRFKKKILLKVQNLNCMILGLLWDLTGEPNKKWFKNMTDIKKKKT